MRLGRRTATAGMLVLASVAHGPAALAETSAWQQRIVPETRPVEGTAATKQLKASPAKPSAKVKSQTVDPKALPSTPLVSPGFDLRPKSAKQSLGPATTQTLASNAISEGGGDPAYEAFDQGKYLTALDLAQKAAQNNDPQAHTLIARIYAEGLGVPKDMALAARWYAKGAELGDTEAQFGLGILYAQGQGVEKNYVAAAQLFEKVAATGHALANYNLALLFLRGQGKPENPRRAFAHMTYAAEKGVVSAQYDLGTLYTTGTGTDPNAFEAAKWFGKAAAAGHTDAEVEYAVILFKGHGVPPDQKKGAYLFRQAAEKGVPIAQNRLARCYAFGAGVPMSLVEAAKWQQLAKGGGFEDEVLDKMLTKLSRADRDKARREADEWRERTLIE
jgi:TPR repeat protein